MRWGREREVIVWARKLIGGGENLHICEQKLSFPEQKRCGTRVPESHR